MREPEAVLFFLDFSTPIPYQPVVDDVALVFALMALVASLWLAAGVIFIFMPRLNRLETRDLPEKGQRHLKEIAKRVDDLTHVVAAAVDRVARSEMRVAKTVKSARQQLQALGIEHAGLEAEAATLFEGNGIGGSDSQVLGVQDGVGGSPEVVAADAPSGIPGMTEGELAEWMESKS